MQTRGHDRVSDWQEPRGDGHEGRTWTAHVREGDVSTLVSPIWQGQSGRRAIARRQILRRRRMEEPAALSALTGFALTHRHPSAAVYVYSSPCTRRGPHLSSARVRSNNYSPYAA